MSAEDTGQEGETMGIVARFKASSFNMETSYVARVYADSLRDNFVGYTPIDVAKFNAVKAEFDAASQDCRPRLSTMLKIEISLIEFLPDAVVISRYWSIYDRFRRVVPARGCDRYDASVPAPGDTKWQDPAFVRVQTCTLLNSIHSNYVVNIGREKSIKRLKMIIAISAVVIVLIYMCLLGLSRNEYEIGLITLSAAGAFGAFLSVLNRMQTAVESDATLSDGIYELTGLRLGWIGIIISFVLGSCFSLVMYCIVMAGTLDLATAVTETIPAATGNAGQGVGAPTNAPTSGPPTSGSAADQSGPRETHPTAKSGGKANPARAAASSGDRNDTGRPVFATQEAKALGFHDAKDFYKMWLLAFLAGFAERLVPIFSIA